MLSLCCLLLTIATAFAAPKTQIVSGSPARDCEFPSIVYLMTMDSPWSRRYKACGGTLIDSTHVLTAAHCVDGNPGLVKVNIGSNNKHRGGQQSTEASRIQIHSGFVNTPYEIKNDVAILTLKNPVHEDRCVKFATMARSGETFGKSRCIAAGWGRFSLHGQTPNELYKVALPHVPRNECKRRSHMNISPGVLCAGDFIAGSGSVCKGDSGGPLFCPSSSGQMVLAGVSSFVHDCNIDISAFSQVSYFRRWIEQQL